MAQLDARVRYLEQDLETRVMALEAQVALLIEALRGVAKVLEEISTVLEITTAYRRVRK